MAKIIGNTTATPNPRPDWLQNDEVKADYIKNKPNIVPIFIGTNKQYDAKKDEIPVGAIVILLDEVSISTTGALVLNDNAATLSADGTLTFENLPSLTRNGVLLFNN